MSPRRLALARFLIRRYPRRWRERYADEMLAMIDDAGVTPLGLLDLARGAAGEQAREGVAFFLGGWAQRLESKYFGARRLLIWFGGAVVLWLGGEGLGHRLAANGAALPQFFRLASFLSILAGIGRVAWLRSAIFWTRGEPVRTPTPGMGYAETSLWLAAVPMFALVRALTVPPRTELSFLSFTAMLVVGLCEVSRRGPTDLSLLQQQVMRLGPVRRSILGLSEPDDAR